MFIETAPPSGASNQSAFIRPLDCQPIGLSRPWAVAFSSIVLTLAFGDIGLPVPTMLASYISSRRH
jgi:hypothetical protein